MKKSLLIILTVAFGLATFAQQRVQLPRELRDYAVSKGAAIQQPTDFVKPQAMASVKSTKSVVEQEIGGTRYDLQTNNSVQNRLNVYDDGTVGATWTMGFADPGFADRGTGYNYFDGSAWGASPTTRIESLRTGWPSYAPYGENGELVVSHDFAAGSLIYLTRDTKGTGTWTEGEMVGPGTQISWNRTTTSGINNNVIQTIAITWPTANGGTVYEGLDGALLYSRSTDGGATWDPSNAILDGITIDEYTGFSADDYEWAASKGDNIAFLVGSSWHDLFLMKSDDGGENWDKTVIWEHPYPGFNIATPTVTDTFYCVDGAHHLAFDSQAKVHVVFGINRTYSDGAGTFWFPYVDGLGYWNEDMPTFSNDLNALSPYGDAGTELIEDVNLIGWAQDVNNDGEITFLGETGTYYIGVSSQPQIIIDDMDYKYVVFAGITETYNNGVQDYRHIWARGSWGDDVWGGFVDLTSDIVHIFDECVFPSSAPMVDDYFYLMYQSDTEPGLAVRGDLDPYGDNKINFMKVSRNELIPVGVDEKPIISQSTVSQNFPNPFNGKSFVNVTVNKACALNMKVTDHLGRQVYQMPERSVAAGSLRLEVNAQNWAPGIYFYSVSAGDVTITKKMIVD